MITYKGRKIPETFEEIVDPKHTALIVHEMLNDFISEGGRGTQTTGGPIDVSKIMAPMVTLIDEARSNNVRVIYVRYTNYADHRTLGDPMIQQSFKRIMDPNSPPPAGLEGTWGHEIVDEVKPHEGDMVLNKYKVDAFIGTNLEALLRWNGIKTIVIVGVGAEAGIVPTVIHANNLGFFVVAPEDCIRPTHPDWLDIAMKFIGRSSIVRPSSDVIEAWESS